MEKHFEAIFQINKIIYIRKPQKKIKKIKKPNQKERGHIQRDCRATERGEGWSSIAGSQCRAKKGEEKRRRAK